MKKSTEKKFNMKNLCNFLPLPLGEVDAKQTERENSPSGTTCRLPHRGRKFAFTLAEVLITLGIIGVVAAMTLPTLIQNYKKTVWTDQLKKSVSVIEQGFHKMMADEEVTKLSDTEFWKLVWGNPYDCDNDDITEYNNILKKYFNIIKFYEESCNDNCPVGTHKGEYYKFLGHDGGDYYDSDTRKIRLADGSLAGLYAHVMSNIADKRVAIISIDVNGEDKLPNQWGRDSFNFELMDNGQLVPLNKDDWEQYNECGNDRNTSNIKDSAGYGCAARIMQNGWKMDY